MHKLLTLFSGHWLLNGRASEAHHGFLIITWKLPKLEISKFHCVVEHLFIFQYSKNNFEIYSRK